MMRCAASTGTASILFAHIRNSTVVAGLAEGYHEIVVFPQLNRPFTGFDQILVNRSAQGGVLGKAPPVQSEYRCDRVKGRIIGA